jgi:hypothetical protein
MYGDFVFDLFSVYQDVKPKILLEAGEFLVYEGRPAIFWDLKIPNEMQESLAKYGFAVDTYTVDGETWGVLAQYTKEKSTAESKSACLHADLQLYCEYCDEVFQYGTAQHDSKGALCPSCGKGDDLEPWGNDW